MVKYNSKSNILRGEWGENKAAAYLEGKKFQILERNFSCKTGEIDIIAKNNSFLVFVEVKTRTRKEFGLPCDFISRKKQHRIILSAEYYMLQNPSNLQPRFDVIEILVTKDGAFIRHTENAFTL